MGMSQKEGEAYQALLKAVVKAMHETNPDHLGPDHICDVAGEYLDMDGGVALAAEELVVVIMEENRANPDTRRASSPSGEPEPPYLF
jgi:hypothetical protein